MYDGQLALTFDDVVEATRAPGLLSIPARCTLAQAESIVRAEVGWEIGQHAFNLLVQGVIEISRHG
jgi:hypothetical protein